MTDHIVLHATPRALIEAQRINQPTFQVRCKAMPPGTRAELIGGVDRQ
jgi:hypothetical protein